MTRFIDIARRIKKDYSSCLIFSHSTTAGDLECQNVAMHITHDASALEMLIVHTLEIFKYITRLELHWITGINLVTINKQLEEMRGEGYLEYNLPYNQEILLKNLAALEQSGIFFNPSKVALNLKSHQTLKQYQLTAELGKRLLLTGKHDSYKIENLDFSVIQLNQNIVIADVLKALSGNQKEVDSWYYASIEKLLLDNTAVHREKGITLQGFTADTLINYREYFGCTLYELVDSISFEKLGTVIEQNNKLVIIDGIESKLCPIIPQTDIINCISKKLFKSGISSETYDVRPINDKFGADNPENIAIFSIIIQQPSVWTRIFKTFPELKTGYFAEFSTTITETKWNISFNAIFIPDIEIYASIVEYLSEKIHVKYQNVSVVIQKDIVDFLFEIIGKIKYFYGNKWCYDSDELIQAVLEKEHSKKDNIIVFEEDAIKKDMQQFLEKTTIHSLNQEIITSRHSKPKVLITIKNFNELYEKKVSENILNQDIFINQKKKITYLLIFLPENTLLAFQSYVFFNMIKDIENKIVTKNELLEIYNKNIARSLKNISQYTTKYDLNIDVRKNLSIPIDELYNNFKSNFKIKVYLFEQEIEKWLKKFQKLSSEELITNYQIATIRNESYVVLEVTEAFAKLAKANLKVEGNDWLALFTESVIKGRVSIADNVSRPFYVKIIPNQLTNLLIAYLVYIRLFIKSNDLTTLTQTELETKINNYIEELQENYKTIGKDSQKLMFNKDELVVVIKKLFV